MKRIIITVMIVGSCLGCAGKQKAAEPPAAQEQTKSEPIPQLSQEEMMKKFQEASTPGQAHAALSPMIGKWKTEAKMFEPGKEPTVDKGTANHQWMYGKRFIKQEYNGKFQGQKFQGSGVIGYDNVKKEYVSTWLDSMGTGVMIAEGKFDPANKTLELVGKYSCPLTGGERTAREVTKFVDKNQFVFEMYDVQPDGKETKMMEITYKRM